MNTEEQDAYAQFVDYFKDRDIQDLTEDELEQYMRFMVFQQTSAFHNIRMLSTIAKWKFDVKEFTTISRSNSHKRIENSISGIIDKDHSFAHNDLTNIPNISRGSISSTPSNSVGVYMELAEIRKEIAALKENQEILKDIIYRNVSSYGAESIKQMIPVHIYLNEDDPNKIYTIYQSVLDFLNILEFETSIAFEAKKGSWWKQWVSISKNAMTSKEVTDRLKEAEYAVEVNTILKPQSEVEKNQSEALLNILKSLEGTHHGVIRIGSLLVVKVTSKEGEVNVQVRTLNIVELHTLNKHPELLNQPQQILSELIRIISKEEEE